MLRKGLKGWWKVERIVGSRGSEGEQGRVMKSEGSERKYSRLAFFHLCIFVTASEGEELIVEIDSRHGEVNREGSADVSGL
jgi:hypothetical protein